MKRMAVLGLLALLALAAMAGQTHASLVFDFSFTNEYYGNVPGTVSGQILGLVDNEAGQSATQVVIDSYPAVMNGLGTPPIDAVGWNDQVINSFTVTDGQVTSASFQALKLVSGFTTNLLDLNHDTVNALVYQLPEYDPPSSLEVINQNGLPGANIVPASTPEPASIALLASGIFTAVGLGLHRRRRPISTASG